MAVDPLGMIDLMMILSGARGWRLFARRIGNSGPTGLNLLRGVIRRTDVDAAGHRDIGLFEGAGAGKEDGSRRGVLGGQGDDSRTDKIRR